MTNRSNDRLVQHMRSVNRDQKAYYEIPGTNRPRPDADDDSREAPSPGKPKRRGLVTTLWSRARHGVGAVIRHGIGLSEYADALALKWLGDLDGKRVLDLGCHQGNPLSLRIARESGDYLGVDLAESAIRRLNEKLAALPFARAEAVDFLDESYPWGQFDVVYARSVCHHYSTVP